MALSDEQKDLMSSLSLPLVFDECSDEEICEIEDKILRALQHHGIEDDKLNDYGNLCMSVIDILPLD